jgi:hypothetical protein
MVYGELGRYPIDIDIKVRTISYWARLLSGKQTYGVYFQNHDCLQWMVAVLASDSGSL